MRFQLHALSYNLGYFLRTLATPKPIKDWLLTSIVSHGRYAAFQMAEAAVPRALFADILRLIDGLRPLPDPVPT